MLVHRRRVASFALSATLFALALGCAPATLPRFDDGKNTGVGGFNGATGTGGATNTGTTGNPTPTPAPTQAPVNYGTLTWKRATQTLSVPTTFLGATVLGGNFVVVGGINATGGGLLDTVTAFPVAADVMSNGQSLRAYRSNIQSGGVCSHGTYAFGNHLVVVGGQTDRYGYTAPTVTALRDDLITGIWADSLDMPASDPIDGGRQDFGAAQTGTYAYVVGGNKGGVGTTTRGNFTSDILVATHSNGALNNWALAGSLAAPTIAPATVVLNNRLYVFGGQEEGTSGPVMSNRVSSYAINADGTLGARQTETSDLDTSGTIPGASGATLLGFGNNLYLIGGMGSVGPRVECYIAVVGADGKLSKWKRGGDLPDKLALTAAGTDTAGNFYLAGGQTETPTSPQGGEPTAQLYLGTAKLQ